MDYQRNKSFRLNPASPLLQRREARYLATAAGYGRIQREGEVVHLVANRLTDLSPELSSIGKCDGDFPIPHSRGDRAKTGSGPNPRKTMGPKAREIYVCDLHIDTINA